jgi:hypothetical protein
MAQQNKSYVPKTEPVLDEERAVIKDEAPKKRKMGSNLRQQVLEYPAVEA